jgi:hypothetical protein
MAKSVSDLVDCGEIQRYSLHVHLSRWTSSPCHHPDLRRRLHHPLSADVHRGEPPCRELLVDLCAQLVLRLHGDRLGDCAGVGAAGQAALRVAVQSSEARAVSVQR